MSLIHVAVVGYGLAGKVFHAPLIHAVEGLKLAVIVSSDAGKVHADFPDVAIVPDFETVLHDDAIDLVVLATPDHLHAEQAAAALNAGKHVVIDKPFAPKLDDAREIAVLAAERNRTLAIFQNRRWDADFLTLKRLIADGELGEIVQFESHFDRLRLVPSVGWKGARHAGLWQDLGPHLVDQALNLFGMPKAVFADICAQRADARAPDYAHVLLRYERLRVILHMTQSTHASGARFAVHGTRGSYVKYGLDPQEEQSKAGMRPTDPHWGSDDRAGILTRVGADGAVKETRIETERGRYPAFYAELRDSLRGHGANPVPPQEAINVMTILDAGSLSTAERREVEI